jgi:hypothetical protein
MRITMVKKRLADGSECRKCQEATAYLRAQGLWERIDEIVWADERDTASPGMALAAELGVAQAPFFVVGDESGDSVYVSVLQLARERLGASTSRGQQARTIDIDDVGGI